MKYYKDTDVMSLNEDYFSAQDLSIKHEEIRYEFERVSLAYRELNRFSQKLAIYLGINIKFLDLTYNNLKNLEFLSNFPSLHTVVLDRNPRLNFKTLPYMPKLKILWLNNCNIVNTKDWILELKYKCPNIKQLSMMCNPVGLTCLNGVSQDEEKEYRKEVAKLLPTLTHFDGVPIMPMDNKFEENKVLQIKYTLSKKWKSLWDLNQNFKILVYEKNFIFKENVKKNQVY